MQRLYIKLAVSLGALALLLSAPFAFASTFYQQLTDSSNQKAVNTNNCTNAGAFTVSTTTIIASGDTGLIVGSINNTGVNAVGLDLRIVTAPLLSNCSGGTVLATYHTALYDGSTNTGDLFMTLTAAGSLPVVLNAGTYYLAIGGLSQANANWKISFNLSGDFFYGYLTANGTGTSIPIAPGLPGFSDTGIATTSQQQYCYSNFATSTGLLDSLGQSIGLGFCNVSAFLFIPSSNTVNNFSQSLAMITNKAPFSWITGVRNDLTSLSASSTENFINLDLNLGTTTAALGMTSLEVISTSTMSKYYPDSTRETARTLIGVAFGLLAVSFFYRKLQNIWHQQV